MATGGDLGQQSMWLGAGELEPKDRYVFVFVPTLTRDGRSLDHKHWRDETVRTMSRLFGGATSVRGFGAWLDEEMGGKVKEEAISMVVSFITSDEWNEDNLPELRKSLHRMGREAEQGEIGILVDGVFLRIRRFDDEA
jgi:hypothetical protein